MTYFTENQKFTDWGIAVFFALLGLPLLMFVISYLITKDAEILAALGTTLFVTSILVLVFILPTLKTEITDKGIYLSFKPLTNRFIAWHEIAEAEIIKYSFVGYGWRLSFKYGKVYNVKGNKGLRLKLKNNKKLVIGTQQKKQLQKALDEVIKAKLLTLS